jgi:hypothetical protein
MNAWIEKQKYLIDFTLSSLARRKAKNLGLLLVYALIVFLLASVMLFTHALRQAATQVLAGAPEIVLQRMVAGRHDLIPPGYLERIGHIRGVQQKEGRLWGYYYDPVVKANYTFMVPNHQDIAAGTLFVGAGMARARGLAIGNLISFRSYSGQLFSFTIAGILPSDSELVSADLVLMSEADFLAFFAIAAGHFTDIALSVANPLEVRNIASKLAQQFPDARPILREEILRTYESIFNWREGIVLALASLTILAFAILAWEKGFRPVGRREARDRHSQGDRLGDRRCAEDEVLGRGPDLAGGFPDRLPRCLPARLPLLLVAFRPGPQGLGGALPALRTEPGDRRLPSRDAVLFHRLPLRCCHPGADLAGGNYRSRRRDARLSER